MTATTAQHDPILFRTGIAIALRSVARVVDARMTPEAQLDWCLRAGMVTHRERDVLTLTPKGEQTVWIFWHSYMENRRARLAASTTGRESIRLSTTGATVTPTEDETDLVVTAATEEELTAAAEVALPQLDLPTDEQTVSEQ